MDIAEITRLLKEQAREIGFSLCGVCPAAPPPGASRFDAWLRAGYAGEMHYLADRREAYSDPRHVLEGVRSIVMLAMNYGTAGRQEAGAGEGQVSRYAWGEVDYHDLVRERLNQLSDFLRELEPEARVRGVVDTAPLMEREFAQLSGLGWVGKNTLLIHRQQGSWFFLAALLTDVELLYDAPYETDHCGTCRACLDACPTNAFPRPYVLDATRCISYLTIELRNAIPAELRPGIGDWLFGCDVCQDVCPWNHRAPLASESSFQPRADSNPMDLVAMFRLDDAAFRERFRHTPLWRAKRRGILRNAAIVLGNRPTPSALPVLRHGLNDADPLVRGACAWALGRYKDPAVSDALRHRSKIELDASVLREIESALAIAVDRAAAEPAQSSI
jgi:epoxyqueuosine reductase